MASIRPTAPTPRLPAAACGGASACCGGSSGGPGAPPGSSVLVTAGGATYSLDLAYWLGIRASLASKQPLTLKVVVQVIRSLDGRDKITKIIQYGCRFLWWHYSRQADAFSKEKGKRFETMFRASQTARKCFHLFRSLEELEKIQALLYDKKTPEWRRRAQLLRAMAMAVYWMYDNTCFFINIKLSSYDPVKALTRDGAAWTLANAISIWLALHDLGQHSQERARLEQRLASVLLSARGGASSSSSTTAAAASSPVPTAAAATNGNGKDGNGSSHAAVPGEPTAAPAPAAPQQPAGQAQAQQPRPYEREGAGKEAEEVVVPVADDAAVAEALEAIARADVRQFDLLGDLVRSTCDLLVACNSTGFDLPKRLLGYKLHDGIIGVAGLLSAVSAVYKAYPSLPPSQAPVRSSLVVVQPAKKKAA